LHGPVTHGPRDAGGNAQPATAYGEDSVAIGCPDTRTRGKGATGMACPPCAQMTVAPRWRMKPGIAALQVIVRAPLLMSTTGPAMVMVATPFVMMMPACVIMMRGLVGEAIGPEQIVMPAPGAPITVREFWPIVWNTMFGVGGGAASAMPGRSG